MESPVLINFEQNISKYYFVTVFFFITLHCNIKANQKMKIEPFTKNTAEYYLYKNRIQS